VYYTILGVVLTILVLFLLYKGIYDVSKSAMKKRSAIKASDVNFDDETDQQSMTVEPSQSATSKTPIKRHQKWVWAIGVLVVTAVAIYPVIMAIIDSPYDTYKKNASALMNKRSQIMQDASATADQYGKDDGGTASLTDLGAIQTRLSLLADKYISTYQTYYDQLKEISDELSKITPPSEFKAFHELYLKSCDSYLKFFASVIKGLGLLKNIDASAQALIQEAQAITNSHLNEANNYNKQAGEAWPE